MRQFLLRKIILLILIALVSGCSTPEYKKDSLYSGLLDPGTVSVSAEKFKSGRRLALVLSNNSWKTMAKIHEVQLALLHKSNNRLISPYPNPIDGFRV